MGYGFCDQAEQADLVLFNTCAIRENAEDRIFGNVGALKGKAQSPKHKLLLCGCMMQQPHIVEKLKQSYPYVDLIFGTHVIHQLPELLLSVLQQHAGVLHPGIRRRDCRRAAHPPGRNAESLGSHYVRMQ